MNRIGTLVGLAWLTATQGACVLRPLDGQTLAAYDTPVPFWGFAHGPNAKVTIQVLHHGNHVWQTVGSAVSSSTPNSYYGEPMYSWELTTPIVQIGDSGTVGCRWYSNCGISLYKSEPAEASVRVKEEGWFSLVGFDDASLACFIERAKGQSVAAAYARCRDAGEPDVIHLHLKGG